MGDVLYANVIVDVNSSHVDVEYEYAVPQEYAPFIRTGSRVGVPFGQSNRLVLGYVTEVYEAKRFEGEAKTIDTLLDYEPLINDEQMQLARFIKQETLSTFVSAINLMVPKKMRLKADKYLYINDFTQLDADLALLIKGSQMVKLDSRFKDYSQKLSREIRKGNIEIRYGLHESGNVKTIRKYIINNKYYHENSDLLRSLRQKEFLRDFAGNDTALSMDDITERYGVSEWIIRTLVKNQYINEVLTEVSRIKKRFLNYSKIFEADDEISETADKIQKGLVPSLFNVTCYEDEAKLLVDLVKRYLNLNRQILIVVPNVVLVFKTASIIRANRIDAEVVTFTGSLSDGEFYDAYKASKSGDADIVITSTVGAFAPLSEIGLIIMMDEENPCYYNQQSPRYDMHNILEFRAQYHHAALLLMSVAPSVCTYAKALTGKYQLLEDSRKDLITSSVIDLTEELKKGNRSPLAVEMKDALKSNLDQNRQSLLILNTRGYSRFVICRECGEVIRCPKCGLSLSYHQKDNKLKCAACGYQTPFIQECPKCHSSYIRHMGFGIEQLTEFLSQTFKEARIITFDEENFEEFLEKMSMIADHECDIIVAPDVYSRAIMESEITLVGVLALDLLLQMPSYLASERAYAMLSHAGFHASGREDSRMIIQTYNPDHYVVKHFIANDYTDFFKEEINYREAGFNEPICHLNRILIKGPYKEAYKTADLIKRVLYELIKKNLIVLGPSYSTKEQAVQLFVKHQYAQINKIYQTIYEKYQTSNLLIIFQKYAQDLS